MRRLGSAGMSYTQVFLLIISFGLTSGLIFLFGMWWGLDLTERRLAQEERIVRAPVPAQPSPAPDQGHERDVDRAFYERLKEKAVHRLEDTPVQSPAVVATLTPLALGQIPTLSRTWALPTDRPTGRPTPRPTSTMRTVPTLEPQSDEDDRGWADAGWTVQITATTNLDEARSLAQRLRSRGYDAYTVQAPTRGGPTWYRVRVGRFSNRDKARARDLETRLRAEENLPNAYTTPQ